MATSSPEKRQSAPLSPEHSTNVLQPAKLEGARIDTAALTTFLEGINGLQVSEAEAGGPGEQGAGASGGKALQAQASGTAVSARQQAIANLPLPAVMQKQLEKHIRMEVKKLRQQANIVARTARPGAAFHLNQLYARIRSLNALLAELFESSVEALKRLFIRVFIDRQTIL